MFDALQIAATGMYAQQQAVDTIANNLANVNTTGFKKARLSFTDLVSRQAASASQGGGSDLAANTAVPGVGSGVAVGRLVTSFDSGELRQTDSVYDVTVSGDGFIEVVTPDGGRAFTRGGTLRVTEDGQLAMALSGAVLRPGINLPDDIQELSISTDGRVRVRTATGRSPVEVGQIDMVRFQSTSDLAPLGNGLYRPADEAAAPIVGRAGQDGMGQIRQGYLEASNVKLVDETVNLMIAQRAYEANVKVIQTTDEMLAMVNNLRK